MARASIGVALPFAAIFAVMILAWYRSLDTLPSQTSRTVETDLQNASAEADAREPDERKTATDEAAAPPEDGVTIRERASFEAAALLQRPSEERFAAIERELAQNLLARDGEELVQRLIGLGLAPSDSEAIVQGALEGIASCTAEALWSAAEEQAVPFDAVLDAAAAALFDADGPTLRSMVDVRAVETSALPCVLNELQQAGIPLQ